MQYYQCSKYPIEFVLSENIDKHFDSHNHVGHYVISVVMQGTVAVCLENEEVVCRIGDVFIIPPYAVHSVCQGRDAHLLSMCVGTALIEETDLETAEDIVQKLLLEIMEQGIFGMTPHQFCIQNRIRKSQGLLDEEKTISRIAAEMGFYDQSHFDKAFQRIVGISPSEYICSKKQIGQNT